MATISNKLQQILDNLPGGRNGDDYQAFITLLDQFPELLDQLNSSAESGAFTGITISDSIQGGSDSNGDFRFNSNYIDPLVVGMQSSDSTTRAASANDLATLLGHEDEHADNALNVANEESAMVQDGYLSPGASAAQTDQWVAQYASIGLDDEAGANIRGWNDVVNGNPDITDVADLIKVDPRAFTLFMEQTAADGTISYIPRQGITLNSDFTITADGSALGMSNIQAAAGAIALFSPSTGDTTSAADYMDFYYSQAIEQAGILESGSISVSYSALGLTIPSRSASLNDIPSSPNGLSSEVIGEYIAKGIYDQLLTIHNTDDGSTSTFVSSTLNGGTTLYTYHNVISENGIAVDNTYNISHDGSVYYSENKETDDDGITTTTVYITKSGDPVAVDVASIYVSSSVQASINGDMNDIILDSGTVSSPTEASVTGDGNIFHLSDNSYSKVSVSGGDEIVNSNGNAVNLIGDDTGVQINGSSNAIALEGNGQSLALAGSDTVNIENNLKNEAITGVGQTFATVNAGSGDGIAIDNVSFIVLTSGNDTTLDISGANYGQLTVGDHSALTLAGGASVYYSAQMSNGSVTVSGDAGLSLTGSSNDVTTGDSTGGFTIQGDENTFQGGKGRMYLTGSDNNVSLSEGSTITFLGDASGNTLNLSGSTISTSSLASAGASATINGSNNIGIYLYDGTYEVNGDGNTISLLGGENMTTLNVSGSSNTVSGDKQIINLLSGSSNTVTAGESTIIATAVTDAVIAGGLNEVTTAGGHFTISDDYNTLTGTATSNLMISGNSNTVTETAASTFAVSGLFNSVTGVAGSTFNITGDDNIIHASHAIITLADDLSVTIVGTDNHISGGSGDRIDITGANNAVSATNSQIYFDSVNGGTVTGVGDGGNNWSAPDPDLPPGENGGYTPPQTASAMAAVPPSLHSLIHAIAAFGSSGGGVSETATVLHSQGEHLYLSVSA